MSAGPQVTFTSDFFTPIAGEEEETYPGRYGKALAQWLAAQLKERGVSAHSRSTEECHITSRSIGRQEGYRLFGAAELHVIFQAGSDNLSRNVINAD